MGNVDDGSTHRSTQPASYSPQPSQRPAFTSRGCWPSAPSSRTPAPPSWAGPTAASRVRCSSLLNRTLLLFSPDFLHSPDPKLLFDTMSFQPLFLFGRIFGDCISVLTQISTFSRTLIASLIPWTNKSLMREGSTGLLLRGFSHQPFFSCRRKLPPPSPKGGLKRAQDRFPPPRTAGSPRGTQRAPSWSGTSPTSRPSTATPPTPSPPPAPGPSPIK